MKIEPMTLENYWNQMKEAFPDSVEHFCKWIDKYKADNNWDELFNCGPSNTVVDPDNPNMFKVHKIKFHDLPFEMQMGILMRYETEVSHLYGNNNLDFKNAFKKQTNTYKVQLGVFFKSFQKQLDKRSKNIN